MLATFSLSVNRNCANMASRSFSSEQKSARGVNKNHHKDNWLMAAATRSSDANIRQSADCRELEPKMFTRKRSFQKKNRSCFFLLLGFFSNFVEQLVFLIICPTSQKLRFRLLRTCFFFLLLRTRLLACSRPLFPLRTSSYPSSTREVLSEHVKVIALPCSRTISHNSSCRKV